MHIYRHFINIITTLNIMIKTISMKTVYNNYTVFEKEFKDDKHFDNWFNLVTRKGNKIIGIYDN